MWLVTVISEKYNALEQVIRDNHFYDTPEILAIQVVAGSTSYLKWIEDETDATKVS